MTEKIEVSVKSYNETVKDCAEDPCRCKAFFCKRSGTCRLDYIIPEIATTVIKKPYPQRRMPVTVQEQAKYVLGCEVWDHELIKGNLEAIAALEAATSLRQINEILHQRHVQLHGESIILNGASNIKEWKAHKKAAKSKRL